MIRELSSRIAKWLEHEGVISDEDKELFSYAVYSLFFDLMPIFIVTVLGIAFKMLGEGLLIIIPFMMIRKFSGGYHLNSPKLCIICSIMLLALAMGFSKVIISGGQISILTAFVVLAVISLCVSSPIDNDNRKLRKNEQLLFRKIVCILAVISLVIYLAMCEVTPIQYTAAFGIGILLAETLQILGIIAQKRSEQ